MQSLLSLLIWSLVQPKRDCKTKRQEDKGKDGWLPKKGQGWPLAIDRPVALIFISTTVKCYDGKNNSEFFE